MADILSSECWLLSASGPQSGDAEQKGPLLVQDKPGLSPPPSLSSSITSSQRSPASLAARAVTCPLRV